MSLFNYFRKNDFQEPFNVYQSAFIVLTFVTARGVHRSWVPKHLPLKITFVSWLFCAAILEWAYESQLLSFLVLRRFEQPIDTAADVLKSELPLMVTIDGWQERLLRDSSNPAMREVYQRNVVEKNSVMQYWSAEYIDFLGWKLRNGEGILCSGNN